MISRRRQYQAFGFGKLIWVETGDINIAAWLRVFGLDNILVISNTSSQYKNNVKINIPKGVPVDGCTDIFSKAVLHIENHQVVIDLEPYQFLWLNLVTEIPGITPSFIK